MKLYSYSTARQRLADVLEDASRDGQVQIRRQDGRVYAVTPVSVSWPFASVTGQSVSGLSSRELLRIAREEGMRRGTRAIRSARAGRRPRTKPRRG